MHFETSDGVKISYEIIGEGEPILFIHGWAATKNWWRFILPIEGFKSIIFDLRGHGDSSFGNDYSVDRIISDVIELIDNLGIDECYLIGHSLGGVIATLVAERRRQKKIVLVATPPVLKYSRMQIILLSFMLKRAVSIMRKTFTPKTLYRPTEELLKFIWRESAKGNSDAYIKILKEFNNIDIIEKLKKIDCEKAVIVPLEDKIVPAKAQIDAFSNLCEIIKLPEAGHNVMLEKPREFKEALVKILKS